jgi:uncharacterized protein YdeI (YjbR/CyaY-like superfamily)
VCDVKTDLPKQRSRGEFVTTEATPPQNSVQIESRAEWRAWLEANWQRKDGIWLITFKKSQGEKYVDYDTTVEEALCFGWIDSKSNKLDETRSMLWFAPRKPKTNWSKLNKDRIAKLLAAKLMRPPGLAKVEAAKRDGSWTALDGVEALEIPPDLQAELERYENASAFFEAFPRSVKRGILEWVLNAKRPETRRKRIEETARLANENRRANQWQEKR